MGDKLVDIIDSFGVFCLVTVVLNHVCVFKMAEQYSWDMQNNNILQSPGSCDSTRKELTVSYISE